jgi:hypothetical protein
MISKENQQFSMASFRNIYTSLMPIIAGSTQKEQPRHVSYLKTENQILRSRLPDRSATAQIKVETQIEVETAT